MSRTSSIIRRIRSIHESMIALGTNTSVDNRLPVAEWLGAEVELLEQLRAILANAAQLEGHAVIRQAEFQVAKEILDASIGAKSIALDLLRSCDR